MIDDYPLFPVLSEEAKKEAVLLIEEFQNALSMKANEVISKLYTDIIPYIESDSWTNFRNELLAGFCNWNNKKIQAAYDFNKIRKQIFIQFRDEIMKEMPEELVAENKELKGRIAHLEEFLGGR